MTSFLSKWYTNKNSFFQPNFSRARQALRSPRSSEKINLEASLFAYDIHKLYEKNQTLEQSIQDDFDILFNEDETIYEITVSGDATPSSITIENLTLLSKKLEGLGDRLEILEKGLN